MQNAIRNIYIAHVARSKHVSLFTPFHFSLLQSMVSSFEPNINSLNDDYVSARSRGSSIMAPEYLLNPTAIVVNRQDANDGLIDRQDDYSE
jgi:hypothetical protein